MANYQEQKKKEKDHVVQKSATNAINLALSKQQMNSARQSPLSYIELK